MTLECSVSLRQPLSVAKERAVPISKRKETPIKDASALVKTF